MGVASIKTNGAGSWKVHAVKVICSEKALLRSSLVLYKTNIVQTKTWNEPNNHLSNVFIYFSRYQAA